MAPAFSWRFLFLRRARKTRGAILAATIAESWLEVADRGTRLGLRAAPNRLQVSARLCPLALSGRLIGAALGGWRQPKSPKIYRKRLGRHNPPWRSRLCTRCAHELGPVKSRAGTKPVEAGLAALPFAALLSRPKWQALRPCPIGRCSALGGRFRGRSWPQPQSVSTRTDAHRAAAN